MPDDDPLAARLTSRRRRSTNRPEPVDDDTRHEHRPRDPIARLEAIRDAVDREMMIYDALSPDPMASPLDAARQRFYVEIAAWRRRGCFVHPSPRTLEALELDLESQLRARARKP